MITVTMHENIMTINRGKLAIWYDIIIVVGSEDSTF